MANRFKIVNEVEYEGPARMEPGIQRSIERGETPLHKMSPFKDKKGNILDKLASEGFKDSVEKVGDALGSTEIIEGTNREVLGNLMGYAQMAIMRIKQKERRIKSNLEDLAVRAVKRMFNISEDKFLFDAKLEDQPMAPAQGMRLQNKEPSVEEIQKAFSKSKNPEADMDSFIQAMEDFDLETAKRSLINTLVQGISLADASYYQYGSVETGVDPKTNEKLFTDISEILTKYDSELVELYGASQAVLQHLYWIYPQEAITQAVAGGSGQVGQVEIDDETNPITIRARGLTFPILLHELIKGVLKTPATYVLPDDEAQANLVMQSVDTVPNEAWNLMWGPILSKKLMQKLPREVFEDESKRGEIIFHLIYTIAKMNHKHFFKLLGAVWGVNKDEIERTQNLEKAEAYIQKHEEASIYLKYFVDEIVEKMNQEFLKDKFGAEEDDNETMV